MDEMLYIFNVNDYHKLLIQKALEILKNLSSPISSNVVFNYCRGYSRYGYCTKAKNKSFYVYINKYITTDEKFINTTIHELLHTIDNSGFTSHKGNWKKWAQIVSNNTEYKIEVRGKAGELNYNPKRKKVSKTLCQCPLCLISVNIPNSKIKKNGETNYFCVKCFKPFFAGQPESKLKDLTEGERTLLISNLVNQKTLNSEEVLNFLIYSSKEDTLRLVKYHLKTFALSEDVLKRIYPFIKVDKALLKEIANLYCTGEFDKSIHTRDERLMFERIFAMTKYWTEIIEHGNNYFGYLGVDKYS